MMKAELVSRQGVKAVFAFSGSTGGGKTFTALQFAYGLANKQAHKIGLLDTENGRGRLYDKKLPCGKQFYYVALDPPFTPERYIEGIKVLEDIGVDVIIIDSVSHEWEGEGGCIEIADSQTKFNSYTKKEEPIQGMEKWLKPKMRHKKFVNYLLMCKAQVICCLRALPKTRYDTDEKGKKVVITTEYPIPICEKNFMYEVTHSVILEEQGKKQTTMKAHEDFIPHLSRGNGYITCEDGLAVRKWLDGDIPSAKQTQPPPSAPTTETPIHCEDCNDFVKPHGDYSAQDVAANTKKKYGKTLCADCGAAAKACKEAEN